MEVQTRKINISGIRETEMRRLGEVQGSVQSALASGGKTIELDLADVTYLDLDDLGALIAFARATTGRLGPVRLRNVTASVRWTLEVTQVTPQFELLKA